MLQSIRNIGALLSSMLFLFSLVGCAETSNYRRDCDPLNQSIFCRDQYNRNYEMYGGQPDKAIEGATFDFFAAASLIVSAPETMAGRLFLGEAEAVLRATQEIKLAVEAANKAGMNTEAAAELVVSTRVFAGECEAIAEKATVEYLASIGGKRFLKRFAERAVAAKGLMTDEGMVVAGRVLGRNLTVHTERAVEALDRVAKAAAEAYKIAQ